MRITLIDALGRTVATIADARHGAGDHSFALDAARLPAGVYAVVARLGTEQTVRRITVVR